MRDTSPLALAVGALLMHHDDQDPLPGPQVMRMEDGTLSVVLLLDAGWSPSCAEDAQEVAEVLADDLRRVIGLLRTEG